MLIVFLVLEAAALRFGVQWTRNITRAVDDLSSATQRVQAGDFSFTPTELSGSFRAEPCDNEELYQELIDLAVRFSYSQ